MRSINGGVLLFVAAALGSAQENLRDGACVEDFDAAAGVDYFPQKAEVDHSVHFTVEYFDTYKVVNNTAAGETYVLYQCGTPAPTVPGVAKAFAVPVQRPVLAVTTLLPWIEQLGERGTLAGWATADPYSPCTRQLLATGDIVDATNGSRINYDTVENIIDADVLFWYSANAESDITVAVNEWAETGVLSTGEWIEYLALWYNEEARANSIFETMRGTFECNTRRAQTYVSQGYNVAWAEYRAASDAWNIGSCPNYYCEYTENAGGKMVTAGFEGSRNDSFGGKLHSDAEFLSVVADVDVLVMLQAKIEEFGIPGWEDIYGSAAQAATNKTAVLNGVRAVREGRVYDIRGLGSDAWYEEKSTEPDLVLEDVMAVLNTGVLTQTHERVYLRDVFTEPVAPVTMCSDPGAARELRGDACVEPDSDSTNPVNGVCILSSAYDAERDYFPEKITVEDSLHFDVEYFNSYKLVNTTSQAMVLYQCGTPRPEVTFGDLPVTYISVPVTRALVGTTTLVPWIEQLGERDSIVGVTTNPDFFYSPCLRDRLAAGLVVNAYNASSGGTNATVAASLDHDVDLQSFYSGQSDVTVAVTEYLENTILAQGEWIEFMSLLYNKEAQGQALLDNMVTSFECNTRRAAALGLDPKPLTAWVEYKGFPGAWEIGPCPNYFCEVTELAGGEYLSPKAEGTVAPAFGTHMLHTNEDFAAEMENVEYLIFKGISTAFTLGWEDVYGAMATANKTDILDQIPAVRNRKVYDVTRLGGDAWFEERVSEPDVLLQDMMAVLNPDVLSSVHERVWLRHVFTEASAPEQTCADPSARPLRGNTCVEPTESDTGDDDGSRRTLLIAILVPVLTVAFLAALALIFKPWNWCSRASPEHSVVKTGETATGETLGPEEKESNGV